MTVCPCCGIKSAETLSVHAECAGCGARRVGEPLARTTPELPSYGRALLALALPATLVTLFVALPAAKTYQGYASFDWQTLEAELLGMAWWLRWALPAAAFAVLWSVAKIHRAVYGATARFAGQSIARAGLVLSSLTLIASLAIVGGQIPRHQREAQIAAEARQNSLLYAANSQFLKYRARFGTYPARLEDLRRLPDADGSVARVLANFNVNSYRPSSAQTADNRRAAGSLRPTLEDARFVNNDGDDNRTAREIFTFTNYELVAPGADEILGTTDDRLMRDGAIIEASAPALTSTVSIAATSKTSGVLVGSPQH